MPFKIAAICFQTVLKVSGRSLYLIKIQEMKNFGTIAAFLTLILFTGCSGKNEGRNLTVMTFNIRYDNPGDSINAWPNRVAIVCGLLRNEKPDLLGLQEALWYQYEEIDSAISGYSSVSRGRDDGRKMGEMNSVFYNINRFDYVRDSTFWLSETPNRPGSKGWGASLPRIVTWVELKEKTSQKPLYYFNTHFAHDSDSARMMSAGILLKAVKRIAGKNRFVITGDFNMSPQSKAYTILMEKSSSRAILQDSYLISQVKPEGPAYTTNSFRDTPGRNRIDYIFVRRGMKVLSTSVIVKKEGPVFVSDHWPYKAVISLR
jgi:endonuclease/exonuclease/phosphatase family metal-dependent hydrolase